MPGDDDNFDNGVGDTLVGVVLLRPIFYFLS